jgi:hypothetical protein
MTKMAATAVRTAFLIGAICAAILGAILPAPAAAADDASRTVVIAPVEVSFSANWDPRSFGHFGLPDDEIEEIRRNLAALAQQSFARRLAAAGYKVVDEPTEESLRLQLRIFDVYVNAPLRQEVDPRHSYVFDAGEMSIALELRGPDAGLLASLQDRQRDPGNGFLTLANEITNRAAYRRMLDGWATQLMRLLRQSAGPVPDPPVPRPGSGG